MDHLLCIDHHQYVMCCNESEYGCVWSFRRVIGYLALLRNAACSESKSRSEWWLTSARIAAGRRNKPEISARRRSSVTIRHAWFCRRMVACVCDCLFIVHLIMNALYLFKAPFGELRVTIRPGSSRSWAGFCLHVCSTPPAEPLCVLPSPCSLPSDTREIHWLILANVKTILCWIILPSMPCCACIPWTLLWVFSLPWLFAVLLLLFLNILRFFKKLVWRKTQ